MKQKRELIRRENKERGQKKRVRACVCERDRERRRDRDREYPFLPPTKSTVEVRRNEFLRNKQYTSTF